MFRRQPVPPELAASHEAFTRQVERLEKARSAMLGCLPVGRVEPAPVAVGLDLLDDELAALQADLDSWRIPELEEAWQGCRAALEEARAAIPHTHEVAATTRELEELLEAVEDVDEPLATAWAAAERSWARQLRAARRRR